MHGFLHVQSTDERINTEVSKALAKTKGDSIGMSTASDELCKRLTNCTTAIVNGADALS